MDREDNNPLVFFSSYFSWSLKSVRLFIDNFLDWLAYENEFGFIDRDDDGDESRITGWTNANGFFIDIDSEEFSLVVNCDIDNNE
jgi:hypothetical protein